MRHAERQRLSRVEDLIMRLPWQPREYKRTCGNCGYAWRVPQIGGTGAANFWLQRPGVSESAAEHARKRGPEGRVK